MKVETRKRNSNSLFRSVTPTQNFEVCPETFEFTQGSGTRNIKIKSYLCLRHVLPKTNLNQAILQQNKSTQRQLGMKLKGLSSSRQSTAGGYEQSQRNFQLHQDKKQRKWKREDEVRLSNMNLPQLSDRAHRPKSMKVVYRMPEYSINNAASDKDGGMTESLDTPRLPKMQVKLRREQTEIVTHKDRTFMTKLPEVREVEPGVLERHNTFCGSSLMTDGVPAQDERFRNLQKLLNPTFLKKWDLYPIENVYAKSRQSKYAVKVSPRRPPSVASSRDTADVSSQDSPRQPPEIEEQKQIEETEQIKQTEQTEPLPEGKSW